MNWHCPRCGDVLRPISAADEEWWEEASSEMREQGTEWFLCPDASCACNDMPVVLRYSCTLGLNHPAGDGLAGPTRRRSHFRLALVK